MKKKDRSHRMYLEDIQLSMLRIEEYVDGLTLPQFKKDYKTVDAVIRNFEIIGEASKNLPEEFKQKHPDIPWIEMYLLRNKISHEYFGIDYEIIWDIATNHIPDNRLQVEELLKQ